MQYLLPPQAAGVMSNISTIFTIGHSNQPAANFDGLLEQNEIELLVDVRSKPYSRYHHFNRERLDSRLAAKGIRYLYLGDLLGGHPESSEFYENGRVVYERLAALKSFRRGITRVEEESAKSRVVLMCTEEDPARCHRHPLLASALHERGLRVLHLRRNGLVEGAADFAEQTSFQIPLLETVGEDLTWKSPKIIKLRD